MARLPDMTPPLNGVHIIEKTTLECFDGTARRVFVTDAQYNVAKNMMIVSRTDTSGHITHVNDDFVDASGYERSELIGLPHYVLRHPHMPKAAFQNLWETVLNGDVWTGAVKNLRKDGGYYWVQATVKPLYEDGRIIGFHSVRKRLEREKILEFEAQYAAMRAQETDVM